MNVRRLSTVSFATENSPLQRGSFHTQWRWYFLNDHQQWVLFDKVRACWIVEQNYLFNFFKLFFKHNIKCFWNCLSIFNGIHMVYFSVRKEKMKLFWFSFTRITRIYMLTNISYATPEVYIDKTKSQILPLCLTHFPSNRRRLQITLL